MENYFDDQYRPQIDDIISTSKVMSISFSDAQGPWISPVYYSGSLPRLYFLSSPDTRHGKAIVRRLPMAAAIYSEPASWQKIRGLQISGKVAVVSEEKTAKTSFLKKYPFASLFLAKSRVIDPLIKEKTEGVNFYCFRPAHITLIDNSIKFGFHHTVSLEE